MGVLCFTEFDNVYNNIKTFSIGKACSVVIFVSVCNVDALCSCKILTCLLDDDLISYKIIPVVSYADISLFNEDLNKGNIQIKTFFFIGCCGDIELNAFVSIEQDTRAYIIDKLSLPGLANIFDSKNIFVMDSGHIKENFDHFKDVFNGEGTMETELFSSLTKTTFLFVNIVKTVSIDIIWCLCIAENGIYLEGKTTKEEYLFECSFIQEKLLHVSDGPSVNLIDSLNLVLLDHWNLFDSFLFSPHTATALGTWRDLGKKKLVSLFAKIGIPLSTAKEDYFFIQPETKTFLFKKLNEIAKKYTIDSLFCPSFIRKYTHELKLSSSDIFYILESILCFSEEKTDGHSPSQHMNFSLALSFLSQIPNTKKIKERTKKAICFQKNLFFALKTLLDGNKIRIASTFRYAILHIDQSFLFPFSQFQNLLRLTSFLQLAIKKTRKKERPFVLITLLCNSSTFLATTVASTYFKNSFYFLFSHVSEKLLGYSVHECSFSPIMEIERSKLRLFIQNLQTLHISD